jgi:hypothetical protein
MREAVVVTLMVEIEWKRLAHPCGTYQVKNPFSRVYNVKVSTTWAILTETRQYPPCGCSKKARTLLMPYDGASSAGSNTAIP